MAPHCLAKSLFPSFNTLVILTYSIKFMALGTVLKLILTIKVLNFNALTFVHYGRTEKIIWHGYVKNWCMRMRKH